MKTRFLIILLAFVVSSAMFMTDAYGWCPENKDWPDAPCYAPYQITSEPFEDKVKEDWAKYYDYKGELWMKQKQYEMQQAIQTDSLDKWVDLAESHRNVHHYYYLQGEAPDLNGEYVFTCNMYEDLSNYEEILKDDIILKKFLDIFPSATSYIAGGIDESRPPQTSIIYQYERHGINVSLQMRVFEGDDKEPCLVPRVYTLTYHDDSDVTEIRNSNFDTGEILEFLESLPFRQSPLKQFNLGIAIDEIECRDGLVQVFKKSDRSPACVTPDTAKKLVERNWNACMDRTPYEEGNLCVRSMPGIDFDYAELSRSEFEKIRQDIESMEYDICNIRLKEDKIILDLHQIFEGTEHEKRITSKIPSAVDYEIVYHEGYTDYFINTMTAHECGPLENPVSLNDFNELVQKHERQEFNGIIVDKRLAKEPHEYHFLTNELIEFETGSLGIRLEGVNQRDDLDGKHVKLYGTVSKQGEEFIIVDEIEMLDSIMPTGLSLGNVTIHASIDEIHESPDNYYNQSIIIRGELREHDADVMVHMGVGCNIAKYTTSDKFVPEFISSQQLYDEKGKKHLGVRIGSADNIGIDKSQLLPIEIKNKQVEMTGIFVPAIKDSGDCYHTIYKSGYILTDFEKIKLAEQ